MFTSGLYLRSTSSFTGHHTGFVETMYVRSVPVTVSSRTAKFDLLYRFDTCRCTGLMFTEAVLVAANPFLCGVKGNTIVGKCSPAQLNGGGFR